MIVAVGADEAKFRAQLVSLLAGGGHRVVELGPLSGALSALRSGKPHLLVSAYGAGDASIAFIRGVRAAAELRQLPVLCVDPKAGTNDTVAFLDAGADDAIARPFQPPIFLARVRTLLRRAVWSGDAPEDTAVSVTGGPIELKLLSRNAAVGGKPVELTRLEFDLLAHMLKYPDRAFKRDELLAAVWNYPGNVETRTLDKHVESLRRKVGVYAGMIQTVHGVGYRFNPAAVKA